MWFDVIGCCLVVCWNTWPRYQVAMTNRVDSATLRTLATDADETVRARVAQQKKAPADVLASLRQDESAIVRDAAEAALSKPS